MATADDSPSICDTISVGGSSAMDNLKSQMHTCAVLMPNDKEGFPSSVRALVLIAAILFFQYLHSS